MKLITRVLPLAFLPFVSGCLTSSALKAVKTPTTQTLCDSAARVEKAAVVRDEQLHIYFYGGLDNLAQKGQLTLVIPLAQFRTNIMSANSIRDIRDMYGTLHVSHEAIHAGWQEHLGDDSKLIPVKSISLRPGCFIWQYADDFKLLPSAAQTLYLINPAPVDLGGGPIEFVYVDASIGRPFIDIIVDRTTVTKNEHKGYYALLPLTVPLDVATAPLQAISYYVIMPLSFAIGGFRQ